MDLAFFGMRLLEVVFFVGIAGSAIVVLIVSFGDIRDLRTKGGDHAADKTPGA